MDMDMESNSEYARRLIDAVCRSTGDFPSDGQIDIAARLSPRAITDLGRRLAISETIHSRLIAAAEVVRGSDDLLEAVSYVRSVMFSPQRFVDDDTYSRFPSPGSDSEAAAMVFPLAIFAGLPETIIIYEERGIPESILRDTMGVVSDCIEEYGEKTGVLGLGPNPWVLPFVRGFGFRIGRMQYIREPFPHRIFVYRSRSSGEITTFLDSGRYVRADRSVTSENVHCIRKTRLRFEPGLIAGTAVGQDGYPIHDGDTEDAIVRLGDYELRLGPGFQGLSVHIPADGRLAPDSVVESFRRSHAFFVEHFPEYEISAWFITSWLLDPQLLRYVHKESNIAAFQRHWVRFPKEDGDDEQFFKDVFPGQPATWDLVQPRSSLQHSLLKHAQSGNRWYEAGGFILPEDLP